VASTCTYTPCMAFAFDPQPNLLMFISISISINLALTRASVIVYPPNVPSASGLASHVLATGTPSLSCSEMRAIRSSGRLTPNGV